MADAQALDLRVPDTSHLVDYRTVPYIEWARNRVSMLKAQLRHVRRRGNYVSEAVEQLRKRHRAYNARPAGQARRARYEATGKAYLRRRRYEKSAPGREIRGAYEASLAGQFARCKAQANARRACLTRRVASLTAELEEMGMA
jgi:hypothetical protein